MAPGSIAALIVEDSADDAELAVRALRTAGLEPQPLRVETMEHLNEALEERAWDLVISDFSLPQMNATAALERVREVDPDVPFIIVSGTIGEERAVAAMRAGAHDYVLKGEGLERLAPAVERELREAENRRRRRAEEVARREAEQEVRNLAAIVESSADAMISLGVDGAILSWNAGAEATFGHPAAEIVGKSVMAIVPDDRKEQMAETLARIAEGSSLRDVETVGLHRDGTRLDVSVTVSPIYDDADRVVAASTVARDITDRKRSESRLAFLSDHDPLTGLFNRHRFDQELTREISLAQRYESGGAALALGLDNFKLVNDTLGHQAGDELLRRVADLLSRANVDTLARIGGDEFAIFLRNSNPEEGARKLLEIVKEQPLVKGTRRIRVTASIGIAPLTGEEVTSEELLAQANLAMYEAKDSGGDSFTLFEPERRQREQMGERLHMADRIRSAISEGSFLVYCQPILSVGDGTVSQYELLVRMRDGDDVIAPDRFLPTADRFGLIEEIDQWMVTRAIELLTEQRAQGREICFEVNLSARSMGDAALFARIEKAITRADILPRQLIFEVTETTAIENIAEARQLSERLIELGCRFALDDFGAGFGSFYYLKYLPFDYLKIDGDFIRNLPTNLIDQSMVEATVQVCHRLGKQVIAEYVEDEETLEILRGYGVDFAQGYHIGRPIPVEDVDWEGGAG